MSSNGLLRKSPTNMKESGIGTIELYPVKSVCNLSKVLSSSKWMSDMTTSIRPIFCIPSDEVMVEFKSMGGD